ncbi:MAG: pilus assembly protein PilP [Polyangiaceae bacterium]
MTTRAAIPGIALVFASMLLVGCGDKTNSAAGLSSTPAPPAQRAAAAAAAPDAGLAALAAKTPEYTENDFVESDRNRDPFRSYVSLFVDQGRKPVTNQRAVLLSQYSLDELRLVAIVTGGEYSRAMLVDPTNKGWVVKHGDFLGRPDVVHTGGTNGADYQLNWRVDRVRDGDIVLIREDPAAGGSAPATRVIPLHPESEKGANTN